MKERETGKDWLDPSYGSAVTVIDCTTVVMILYSTCVLRSKRARKYRHHANDMQLPERDVLQQNSVRLQSFLAGIPPRVYICVSISLLFVLCYFSI